VRKRKVMVRGCMKTAWAGGAGDCNDRAHERRPSEVRQPSMSCAGAQVERYVHPIHVVAHLERGLL
jgi:hypothetical protein